MAEPRYCRRCGHWTVLCIACERCGFIPPTRMRIKLPPGWEKCRTGIAHARKWRNMRIGAWVTDREDDPVLHVGLHGTAMKYPREHYTVQEAINCLTAIDADHEEKTGIKVDFSEP